jgi:hypothetical protein
MEHSNRSHTRHLLTRSLAAGCVLAGLWAGLETICAEDSPAPKGVKLPFTVFDEQGSTNNHYIASGWMGNTMGTKLDEGCAANPHGGKTCVRIEYSAPDEWAGIVWQDPANDWGDQPGGWNLTGARKLKFWARGEKGDESVSFKFGILETDKKYSDSATGEITDVKLTKEWTEYAIDLEGKDLTRVKTGFVWTLAGRGSPVIFFLDDIRFE